MAHGLAPVPSRSPAGALSGSVSIIVMRAAVRRVEGLVRRYRLDRRLPPPVKQLYVDVARARGADAAAARRASVLPVLGDGHDGDVARLGGRRLATAGDLSAPTDEIALETAHLVVERLAADGIDVFTVQRDGDRLLIGIDAADRPRALRAIGALREPGWYVESIGGRRTALMPVVEAPSSRRARRAREWIVFRAHRLGERVVGPEVGVVVTFWTPGTSGQMELVGTRGHERFDVRSPHTVERIGAHSFPGRTAFPVGRSLERFDGPIDIVYTWVDGSDPAWVESFRATAQAFGRTVDEEALDPARYRSRDELRYSLRSVWMYCGWVRHIYVVTAGQRPSWLVDHPRVTVVDHREVLPSDGLPTFNSHAIEASLHHIEGLSEHFVYFNDDMLVARPLRPETFFHPNGLPKVFQSGARVPGFEDERTQAVDTAAIRGRELLAERFGRVVESKPYHSPYPLLRSVMAEIENEFPEVVGSTRRSRFRSPTDLSTAASFAQHYAFATGRAVLGDIVTEYVHVESPRLGWHLDRILVTGEIDTCCINETGAHVRARTDREARIAEFFSTMYPVSAPWESDDDR